MSSVVLYFTRSKAKFVITPSIVNTNYESLESYIVYKLRHSISPPTDIKKHNKYNAFEIVFE